MLSATAGWSKYPKSVRLEQLCSASAAQAARIGASLNPCRLPMTGRASAAPQASTLAFLCRRLGVLFHIVDPLFVTLDADDGENDHRCGLFAACGTAEARSTSVVGKFENDTHVGGPAIVRALKATDPSPPTHAHRRWRK